MIVHMGELLNGEDRIVCGAKKQFYGLSEFPKLGRFKNYSYLSHLVTCKRCIKTNNGGKHNNA